MPRDARDTRWDSLNGPSGTATTSRRLAVGEGYYLQDALGTFRWLRRKRAGHGDEHPIAVTPERGDVFRIAFDDRFIIADVCFLLSSSPGGPRVDLTAPVASLVVDTQTGRSSPLVALENRASVAAEFGAPLSLEPRDVCDVWPDWPEIRREWRSDPATMEYLGLR